MYRKYTKNILLFTQVLGHNTAFILYNLLDILHYSRRGNKHTKGGGGTRSCSVFLRGYQKRRIWYEESWGMGLEKFI
jgi:hypothetical protein